MSGNPEAEGPGAESSEAEARALRAVLLVGSLALTVIWWLEWTADAIQPLDHVAYPVLLAALVACLVTVLRNPARAAAVKLVAAVASTAYLLLAFHITVFGGGPAPDMINLAALLCWLPLCYASSFVFFSRRVALTTSVLIYVGTFGPVGVALMAGEPFGLAPRYGVLMANLALATATYVVLLAAISGLRLENVRTRERAETERRLSVTDLLTSLPNRRALTEVLEQHARERVAPLSVLLIDVDHFKAINDSLGHACGDVVLARIGQLLRECTRTLDLVGRWGGEEFMCVARCGGEQAACELGERMRAAVASAAFATGQVVTISLGVAEASPGEAVDSLLRRSDLALYEAKRQGRNRVVLATSPRTLSGAASSDSRPQPA